MTILVDPCKAFGSPGEAFADGCMPVRRESGALRRRKLAPIIILEQYAGIVPRPAIPRQPITRKATLFALLMPRTLAA